MVFGVTGAAWADRNPQKFTGPVDIATLQVASGVQIQVRRNAIAQVLPRGTFKGDKN